MTYKQEKNAETLDKCQEMLDSLPGFCSGYAVSISGFNKPLTQLAYLQRISVFCRWLYEYSVYFAKKPITDFTIDDMALLKKADIEEFLHHLDMYGAASKEEIKTARQTKTVLIGVSDATRNSYISALNSLYNYFLDNEYIEKNPMARIKHRTLGKKEVIALDDYQKDQLLQVIDYGSSKMTKKQLEDREKLSLRDHTIILLALRTGLRVSEIVGLDIDNIDFRKNTIKVHRKRDKDDTVYIDDEVKAYLLEWLEERKIFHPADEERAVFVSGKGQKTGTRLSVRSIQLLVKKYSEFAVPEIASEMHPHRLRSTFCSDLIDETHDIYYAKSAMAHENIQTTTLYIRESQHQKEANRNILLEKESNSTKNIKNKRA